MFGEKTKKRFSINNYLSNFGNMLATTIKRFPLISLFLVILAGLIIFLNEVPYDFNNTVLLVLNRVLGTLIFGVCFSFFMSMVRERFGENLTLFSIILTFVIQISIIISFYFFIFVSTDSVPLLRLFLTSLAFIIGGILAPYVNKDGLEISISRLIGSAAISIFFTICLVVGIIAVLAGVKSLLIESLNTKLYFYTFIVLSTVFTPIHFLSSLPKGPQKYKNKDFPWILRVAFTHILLPLLGIYTIILYVYFGKVIITQSWPSGIVSYLVIAYSAIGILTVFMVDTFKRDNKWVDFFCKFYSKAIFPILAMMFYSIFLRINQYGVTEKRYFIVLIGIWAAVVMLLYNVLKGKRNILFLISLSLILILSCYGPLSSFSVSSKSQETRFNNILIKYDMIKNGKVIRNTNLINDKDQGQLTSIMHYFDSNHKLSDLNVLPNNFSLDDIELVFGYKPYTYNEGDEERFSLGRSDNIIAINGYEKMIDFNYFNDKKSLDYDFTINNIGYKVRFINNLLIVYNDDSELLKIDLNNNIKDLYNLHKDKDRWQLSESDLSNTVENEKVNIKIVYNYIHGIHYKSINSYKFTSIDGLLLISIK